MENESETNWRAIRTPLGRKWSGRERYAAAMYFFQHGEMDADTLEVYRICAKLDDEDPMAILKRQEIGDGWLERLASDDDTSGAEFG